MRLRVAFASIAIVSALCGTIRPARADTKLDGRWRQSSLREEFTVQQWLDTGCGPPPQTTSTGGGEIIDVREEGDELAFVGGGRVFRTNQCYDAMPSLSRASHSRDASGKSWRTQCTTAPKDPRHATLNTLVIATTEAHIDLVETGRYEITLENGRCIADIKRTRSFTLVRDDAPTPTPAANPPAPKPTADVPRPAACTPGNPQRLEVRPSKKLIRTGEGFTFQGSVLDAKGCDTHTPTTWRIASDSAGKGVTVDGSGRVSVAASAAEGSVELVASAAGKDARVTVEIVSPARYDELLARSGLNAAGENDEASTVTIASQSLGAGEGRVEDRSRERRMVFLGIVGAVLLALGVVAVFVHRRSKRADALAREVEDRHEAKVQAALERRKQREAEHGAQMRAHEESVRAARAAQAAAGAKAEAGKARQEMVCTSCGRQEAPGTAFCPHDGTPLTPLSKATPRGAMLQRQPGATSRGKICPTCGERFEGGAEFCGKDGTILVLIN